MNKEERYNLYEKAFKQWGVDSQILQLAEECSELIQRCIKVVNRSHTEETWLNFFEELADVSIMMEQMEMKYGEYIKEYRKKKLQHFKDRLIG